MSTSLPELIIAVGLNENVTRDQNPNVPITPDEIAADIAECVEAGASIIHVHCRNPVTGEPIMDDPDAYVELFHTIHATVDAPVYPTYPNGETVDRYKHVKALMEDPACGLELAPVIAGSADLTPPLEYARAAAQSDWHLHMPLGDLFYQLALAREHDLWVSHDVMEPGGLRTVMSLFRGGEYVHPVLLKFFMSQRMGFGFPPEPRYLDVWAGLVEPDFDGEWLVLPYGVDDATSMALWRHAIATGGHVRVGVGDSPAPEGGFLPTNAERVAQMATIAREMGREVATLAETRARFTRSLV
ncbi:MAG: 3-keto-5-aminohexanoate cleavage protein [Acidimicrobiia bacterium]